MSYQPPFDGNWMTQNGWLTKNDKPPSSIQNAVRFMYAGAAIEVLSGILTLAIYSSLLRSGVPGIQVTPGIWHLAEASGAGYIVVVALTRIGMWLWMASKNKAGRRWARVVSTVVLVIDSFALVKGIVQQIPVEWQEELSKFRAANVLIPVAIWIVGVCAVVLLWQRESSDFYTARSQRY
jgi:hypothetical protein